MKARLPVQGTGGMNFQNLAKQAQEVQERIEQVSTEIDNTDYTSTAGGEAVIVTVTGKPTLKKIAIGEKNAVGISDDQELLFEMIIAAANSAIEKARTDRDQRIKALTGGIAVPGLF